MQFIPLVNATLQSCTDRLQGFAAASPPTGSTWLTRSSPCTQSAMKCARSASLMGLHAASVPSPNMTYGLPPFTSSTWPAMDLKNAVGRTMLYVRSPASCDAAVISLLRTEQNHKIAEPTFAAPIARYIVKQGYYKHRRGTERHEPSTGQNDSHSLRPNERSHSNEQSQGLRFLNHPLLPCAAPKEGGL